MYIMRLPPNPDKVTDQSNCNSLISRIYLVHGTVLYFFLLSYIVCLIGEVDFVEDLRAVLLDGLHLYLMGWQLSGLHSGTTERFMCVNLTL